MAIAGLQNVSVIDSSFPRDSQSRASRQRENDGRTSVPASSLLQMWRELEDDHMMGPTRERDSERWLQQRSDSLSNDISRAEVSDNNDSEHRGVLDGVNLGDSEFGGWSPTPSHVGSQNSSQDLGPFCENSSDMGVVERERVRQIFREWTSSGMGERASDSSHVNNSSRAEWLGETEQERVRIIREWVQMNCQQRGVCGDTREEQPAEVASQIEQVLDGMVINENSSQTEHVRRGIRKLCGRQALLDMLKKAEKERQRELHGLMEHRAVSNFAHRNRIQSLLRGRFLRNGGMADNERPSSSAASELGFLRERHTVSGLREEFISRLDRSISGQTSASHSDTSSNADTDVNRNEQSHLNRLSNDSDANAPSEQNNGETDNPGLSVTVTHSEHQITQNTSLQESTALEEEWQGQVSENMVREWQQSASDEVSERRDDTRELSSYTPEDETPEHNHLQEVGEIFSEQSQRGIDESAIPQQISTPTNSEEGLAETSTHEEQLHEEPLQNEESDWQVIDGEFSDWREDIEEEVEVNMPVSPNQSSQGLLGDQDREQHNLPEAPETHHTDVDDAPETLENWFEEATDQDAVSIGRIDSFYLPDDDNANNMELRELLSRRRVSNLLSSGFRESLDHLIQSYMERQNHTPVDWESQEAEPPALAGQEIEHQDEDHNEGQGAAAESPPLSLPSPMIPVQPLWDHERQNANWPPSDMHQRVGMDWEVVNDLRIDMARLQQRMNNLQTMLETCMDMQLELQRSIRQEVSAAMNRSAGGPSGTSEENLSSYESNWEFVRKGICCICCDTTIDSLLYRCGHMCACSKCANDLVQGLGKCPMCRAPVIEAARAYSIL